ncbi:UNVERIFIED_CONTAM: hypothetical protein GTU68_040562 [Idotea baltica]|nr:hypothetical protein [Idotea baltica]
MVPEGQSSSDALTATTTLAKHAEELGFHRFWVAEHHNMETVASTSPAVLMAHLAANTERIRVGSGGVMLPNHAPLVVAEQFAPVTGGDEPGPNRSRRRPSAGTGFVNGAGVAWHTGQGHRDAEGHSSSPDRCEVARRQTNRTGAVGSFPSHPGAKHGACGHSPRFQRLQCTASRGAWTAIRLRSSLRHGRNPRCGFDLSGVLRAISNPRRAVHHRHCVSHRRRFGRTRRVAFRTGPATSFRDAHGQAHSALAPDEKKRGPWPTPLRSGPGNAELIDLGTRLRSSKVCVTLAERTEASELMPANTLDSWSR